MGVKTLGQSHPNDLVPANRGRWGLEWGRRGAAAAVPGEPTGLGERGHWLDQDELLDLLTEQLRQQAEAV